MPLAGNNFGSLSTYSVYWDGAVTGTLLSTGTTDGLGNILGGSVLHGTIQRGERCLPLHSDNRPEDGLDMDEPGIHHHRRREPDRHAHAPANEHHHAGNTVTATPIIPNTPTNTAQATTTPPDQPLVVPDHPIHRANTARSLLRRAGRGPEREHLRICRPEQQRLGLDGQRVLPVHELVKDSGNAEFQRESRTTRTGATLSQARLTTGRVTVSRRWRQLHKH